MIHPIIFYNDILFIFYCFKCGIFRGRKWIGFTIAFGKSQQFLNAFLVSISMSFYLINISI